MSALNLRIENKIAILEFDQPDSKVNILNTQTMQELTDIINELKAKPEHEVQALLISSKKDGIFIAGADIKEIEKINTIEEAKEKAESGKKIFQRLQSLDLITVAVINGVCVGAGLELALFCKYRVASFSEKVKIGLPEVNLGVIPGFGGTQTLPRLIGLTQGLKMILGGQTLSARDALKYGLVDKLFPETILVEESIDFVKRILENKERIERKRKRKILQIFLEDNFLGRAVLFSQAKKNVLKRTRGFYPAPIKAVEVIKKTYRRNIQRGFQLESQAFAELAITEVSKNLIKVFYLNEEYKKFAWVDTHIKPNPIDKCGIVGAGIMGGGIAQLLSFYDLPVRLKDINYDALKKALKTAQEIFEYALKKARLKPHQVDFKFGLISPTITYKGFENADLVIEAVVEDLEIKQKVFKELSKIVLSKAILASNTSSLPIIKLGENADFKERIVGLHFFNPVHRMPLVEIIKSTQTSDETLATVITFARKIGKVVIVVGDVPGFLINRILLPYINEAGFLLEEGLEIEHIDRTVLKFGMPMGPLELIDEIGIDVGYKVAKILEASYGQRMRVPDIFESIKEKGLLGKKTKSGFYLHQGKNKKPNPDIYNLIKYPGKKIISDENTLKRMIYIMINESARCLEENVADRPSTIDIGMIMGTGFPPFRAGLLRYADKAGIENIVKALKDFERETEDVRFCPCNYLLNLAKENKKFYQEVEE
jgi:3-hydroxyacyl-CoA dehydrogenase/enoyl-CoA hydratase/3-hydroxybutyryl-CoA epimerase